VSLFLIKIHKLKGGRFMSSSGKPTSNYKLNQWAATDKPERADFNSDNQKVDEALGTIKQNLATAQSTANNAVSAAASSQVYSNSAKDLGNPSDGVTSANLFIAPPLNNMATISRHNIAGVGKTIGSPIATSGPEWWEVLTLRGASNRAVQMAIQAFGGTAGLFNGAVYVRTRHRDNNDYTQWQDWQRLVTAKSIYPASDNAYSLGTSSLRFNTAYIASGTISTSDEREKENILSLSEEKIVSFLMSLNPVEYSFKEYGLRSHFGLVAQEVEQALYDNGLNTLDFAGLVISPITEEITTGEYTEEKITDENGNEKITKIPVTKAEIVGSRYGLRYEEFIAPLIKMVQIQQKTIEVMHESIDNLKARLEALEAK